MRRRFGRRRRGGEESRRPAIDAARELARLVERGVVPARRLEPLVSAEVDPRVAAVGVGESEEGEPLVVGFSPESGADAWIGALAVSARRAAEEGFAGTLWAVSPHWSIAARRRLALVGELPFRISAVQEAVPGTVAGCGVRVAPEPAGEPLLVAPQQLAAQLPRSEERELFARALGALEGLALKHGGRVRSRGEGAELVLLAQTVASLRVDAGGVLLDAVAPRRMTLRLRAEGLADALDRLEGFLRKLLSDKKILEGEGGLRGRLAPALALRAGLRDAVLWPLGGREGEAIDALALDAEGWPVALAVRRELALLDLGAILDAAVAARSALPALLASAAPPVRYALPRLALAAERVHPGVDWVLRTLRVPSSTYTIAASGSIEERSRITTPGIEPARERPAEASAERPPEPAAGRPAAKPGEPAVGDRPAAAREPQARPLAPEAESGERTGRYEVFSVFELDDGQESSGRSSGRRRRRRRRGRRPSGEPAPAPGEQAAPPSPAAASPPGAAAEEEPEEQELEIDDDAFEDGLSLVDERVPEVEPEVLGSELALAVSGEETPDEEGVEEGELDGEKEARLAEAQEAAERPQPAPRPVRRRAALVAHADPDAIGAAVVLARDLRLVEGFWIYPQPELMSFFRAVATDLREATPIHVVGFTASPAREVLQAASLYRGRIFWYDHHDWPPEDLEGLRSAIGSEAAHVVPGTGSSLPLVVGVCTTRSRFTDKLIDLLTARFTEHDYQRWGRLWRHRLAQLASRPGERRAEIAPLLVGRPSELAREAETVPLPPLPPELDFVARRDFRLVHFAGYAMVLVPVPPELDLHLVARIARERYQARLSLAWSEGSETLVLAADEGSGRAPVNRVGLVAHLAAKFSWIEPLPDHDHVARIRVRALARHPERLDEVVGEIAMGRAILEG